MMPFDQMARPKDAFYRFFTTNILDLFWKSHEEDREAGYFSDDFKDLITSMLHYHPQHRPMIADIIGHPWIAGETATPDQIRQEFAAR